MTGAEARKAVDYYLVDADSASLKMAGNFYTQLKRFNDDDTIEKSLEEDIRAFISLHRRNFISSAISREDLRNIKKELETLKMLRQDFHKSKSYRQN
ncbi:MAG: hypothetical protein ACRCY4_00430 [Brevinema sp.]